MVARISRLLVLLLVVILPVVLLPTTTVTAQAPAPETAKPAGMGDSSAAGSADRVTAVARAATAAEDDEREGLHLPSVRIGPGTLVI